MRLPRKKKKELKKLHNVFNDLFKGLYTDEVNETANGWTFSFNDYYLKKFKSYPIQFGYGRIGVNHLGEELDSFSVEVPINQQQNEQ